MLAFFKKLKSFSDVISLFGTTAITQRRQLKDRQNITVGTKNIKRMKNGKMYNEIDGDEMAACAPLTCPFERSYCPFIIFFSVFSY
uniref:Uncharacterized protein n=1 Tax=Octopus bimaculoides TaxID=37653 RepID=A0A0L8HX79_OCTBM